MEQKVSELTERQKAIFNHIARGNGSPVPQSAIVEAGLAKNVNTLKSQIRHIRQAYATAALPDPFRSIYRTADAKNWQGIWGYAIAVGQVDKLDLAA